MQPCRAPETAAPSAFAQNSKFFLTKVSLGQIAPVSRRNGPIMSLEMCDERLLTIEQLAERLQYSADWIRTQVKAGRLPAIRFNRRAWRFHWPTVLVALQKLQ